MRSANLVRRAGEELLNMNGTFRSDISNPSSPALFRRFRKDLHCFACAAFPAKFRSPRQSLIPKALPQRTIFQRALDRRRHLLDRTRVKVLQSVAGNLWETRTVRNHRWYAARNRLHHWQTEAFVER